MLRLHDIHASIHPVLRRPAVSVVLAGCPLRCVWCDVPETHFGGTEISLEELLIQVGEHACPRVVLSGGEPMAQAEAPALLERFVVDKPDREVWLDTSGHLDLAEVPPSVRLLADVKCPGSGMAASNRAALPGSLRATDILVYTLLDRHDYEWAKSHLGTHRTEARICFGMARTEPAIERGRLADWVLDDGLDVTCLGVRPA